MYLYVLFPYGAYNQPIKSSQWISLQFNIDPMSQLGINF